MGLILSSFILHPIVKAEMTFHSRVDICLQAAEEPVGATCQGQTHLSLGPLFG